MIVRKTSRLVDWSDNYKRVVFRSALPDWFEGRTERDTDGADGVLRQTSYAMRKECVFYLE